MRYAVYVHDPNGDMGYGVIVGAFKDGALAVKKAEQITRRAEAEGVYIEPIVLDLVEGGTSAAGIVARVASPYVGA